MTVNLSRVLRIERALGIGEREVRQMVFVAPNAWPDIDRAKWETLEQGPLRPAVSDVYSVEVECSAERRDLVAHIHGIDVERVGLVIEVPAPDEVEQADEATRAAWYANNLMHIWHRAGDAVA
ncbi:MAG: hypothetical protein U0Z70_07020 [Thermomicrobiales bacterium]